VLTALLQGETCALIEGCVLSRMGMHRKPALLAHPAKYMKCCCCCRYALSCTGLNLLQPQQSPLYWAGNTSDVGLTHASNMLNFALLGWVGLLGWAGARILIFDLLGWEGRVG
jgi:hypothetical protein